MSIEHRDGFELEVTLSRADLRESQKVRMAGPLRSLNRTRWIGGIVLGAVFATIAVNIESWASYGFALVILGFGLLCQHLQRRQQAMALPTLTGPMRIDGTGVRWVRSELTFSAPWRAFTGVQVADNVIVLELPGLNFVTIPKRCAGDQLEPLLRFIRDHIRPPQAWAPPSPGGPN